MLEKVQHDFHEKTSYLIWQVLSAIEFYDYIGFFDHKFVKQEI